MSIDTVVIPTMNFDDFTEISVPEFELPAVDDSDHNGTTESLKEQEQKWTDLGIQQLQESPHHTGN